jgi:hypothetical protein
VRHSLLAGVSPEEAAAHPIAGAHSIGELVLHMTAWTCEVTLDEAHEELQAKIARLAPQKLDSRVGTTTGRARRLCCPGPSESGPCPEAEALLRSPL